MGDEIKNTKNEETIAPPSTELSEDALEQVTGGEAITTGKHIPKVIIELK